MDIKWGSLYTVVQNLEKHGFVEVIGSERDGARPERIIYQLTESGRAEAEDWTRELISTPEPEHHRFVAGLSVVAMLPPDEVISLLETRIEQLNREIAVARREIEQQVGHLPRLFTIEVEFGVAMLAAEAEWAAALRDEMTSGTFPDIGFWRHIHAENVPFDEAAAMMEGGTFKQSASD